MKYPMVVLLLLLVAGCAWQPGHWRWLHPDAHYAAQYRWRDISECEDYALRVAPNGPPFAVTQARDYGGWGNWDFEFCMEGLGWSLEFLPGKERSR